MESDNPVYWEKENLTCPSFATEYCYKKASPKHINDKESCQIMVEAPYECCFVRYRYHAECLLLDTHDKDVYSRTIHHLMALNGWEDGSEVEILCSIGYIGVKIIPFMILIMMVIL